MTELPTVTIVIPCRNEERFISPCLESLLAGNYPMERLEIIIADGMSEDRTREILDNYARLYSSTTSIRVIDNPERFVAPGLNHAIRLANSEIIVRIDAHSEYAPDYVRQCVEVLGETGAANVGGAVRTRCSGLLQTAISLASHSPFAGGGALSRNIDYEGPVDTVIYGCWLKETLIAIGLFDEAFVRNQDDELNLRLIRAGKSIYQSRRIRSWYRPRASLGALFKQYQQYGYWKALVIRKHRIPASWRHLVPAIWVLATTGLALLSPLSATNGWLLGGELAIYCAAALAATLLTISRAGFWKSIGLLPILPVVFLIYHSAYGAGFLRGVIDFIILRRGAPARFTALSR